MSLADIKHAMKGNNHESLGTRIGLYIDPLHYLSKLWGGQKNYDAFVNKSGDFLNKQGSSVVKPIDKVGRQYDPLHKKITSTAAGDKAATWIVNKPATTAGIIYGGIAGGQALGSIGGSGGSSAAPATSGSSVTGFGGAGTGGLPSNLAGDFAGQTFSSGSVGSGAAGHLAASGSLGGGAAMGSATETGGGAAGLKAGDWAKMGGKLLGGGGQQQPKNNALQAELERQAEEEAIKRKIAEELGPRMI